MVPEPSLPLPGLPLSLRFVRAALWCTLTLGSTWGAVNLLTIHWALGRLPAAHNWIHASFQIWGFSLLVIMGASYEALPRWCGRPLIWAPMARATYWFDLAGLIVLIWARFPHFVSGTVPAVVLGTLLHLAAVLGWVVVVLRNMAGAPRRPGAWAGPALIGLGWWVGASVVMLAAAHSTVMAGEADVSADYNETLYVATLLGGILAWIHALGIDSDSALSPWLCRARGGFALVQLGALLMVMSTRVVPAAGANPAHGCGWALVAAGLANLAWRGVVAVQERGASTVGRAVGRVFSMAAALAAILVLPQAVAEMAGVPPHRFITDGARHAITLGLVSPSILALAAWLVPADPTVEDTGRFVRGLYLIGLGLLLRETQVLATVMRWPDLVYVSGFSGVVAAVGVGLSATVVLARMRRIDDADGRIDDLDSRSVTASS